MNKPTEEHIENYIRYPSDLSTEEKKWIEEWVQKDQELRLLADWYKNFYKKVDQIEKTREHSAEIPALIYLKPYKGISRLSSKSFTLTARSSVSSVEIPAKKTVQTSTTEEHKS